MEDDAPLTGGRALVTLIAAYTGNILISGAVYTIGVIYVALLDHYQEDPVKTSLVGSINAALLCLIAPVAGVLINKYSCRVVIVTGGIIVAFALVVSAFVPNVNWLIVSYGIIGGVGNALAFIPMGVVLGFGFTQHRDIVMALSTVMVGVGMLVSTPLALYIIQQYGVNGTFIILSGIYLNMCVIGMLMKPSPREKRIQKRRKLAKLDRCRTENHYKGGCLGMRDRLLAAALVYIEAPFVLFLISILSWNIMLAVCQMHLPNYMASKNAESVHIASVMICFSISNTIGRLLGVISLARAIALDPFKLTIIALATSGGCITTFPLYKGMMNSEYILATCAGLMTGLPNAIMSPLAIRFMGVDNLSLAHGLIYFSCGVGIIAGPPVASALYKRTGSYDWSFVFAGLVNLSGSVCAIVSAILHKRRDGQDQIQRDIEISTELMNKSLSEKIDLNDSA